MSGAAAMVGAERQDTEARLRRAAAALQGGDGPTALRLVEEALAVTPAHAAALHMKGAILQSIGRFGDAVSVLREAVAAGAGPGAQAVLGAALAHAGDTGGAESVLRLALQAAPGNVVAAYNLGHLLREAGRGDEAEHWLRRATTLAPGHVRAWCDLGALLLDARRESEAAECFASALRADPDHPVALYNSALIDQRRGRYAEACAGFSRCRSRLPPSRGLMLGLAGCLQELGRIDEALAVYRELLALDRSAYALVLRNMTTTSKGVFDLRPSRVRALLGLA